MSVYLDASVFVGWLVESDSFAKRAQIWCSANREELTVSDFATAEFASVIARQTRVGRLSKEEAMVALTSLDLWTAGSATAEDVTSDDIRVATGIIRRLDLNIRTPEAIHLAIALRLGASVATFDRGMAANAQILGVTVAGI